MQYARAVALKLPEIFSVRHSDAELITSANQRLDVGNIGHRAFIQAHSQGVQPGEVDAIPTAFAAVQSDMLSTVLVDKIVGSGTALQAVNAGKLSQVDEIFRAVISACDFGNRAPLIAVFNANLPTVIGISADNGVDDALARRAAVDPARHGALFTKPKVVRVVTANELVHSGEVGGAIVFNPAAPALIARHQHTGVT